MKLKLNQKPLLACLVGYGIFGFSFMFSKIALDMVDPFVLLSLRFLTAFLVMNLMMLMGIVRINLRGKPVKLLLLMGLVQPVLYFIFESYGVAMTTASFSGVMIGLLPVVGLVFGVVFLKEKCTTFQVYCTLLSVMGVILTGSGDMGSNSFMGFVMLLCAVISGAVFTIISRSTSVYFSAFERTYVMFALGSVVFTVISIVRNHGDKAVILDALTKPEFLTAILYLAVVSSVCAFMLINYALSHESAGKLLICSNFTPVISLLAGIVFMGDSFTVVQLAGIFIIILSVFGVSYQKPEKAS